MGCYCYIVPLPHTWRSDWLIRAMSGETRSLILLGVHPSQNRQAEQQTGRTAGNRTTVIALRLRLFNFVRTVELRKAECGEFDLGRAE